VSRLRFLAPLIPLGVIAALLSAGGSPAAPPAPSTTVVMAGLNNPRGLAFGPDGALYVAEAGAGGTGQCLPIRGETQCVGATGSVSRLRRDQQERIATGLPSYAPQTQPASDGATGPHDIEFQGGRGWITIGLGGDPAVIRAAFGNGFGRLVRMNRRGDWSFSTDVASHEQTNNPDNGPIDSNPYGLLLRHGAKYVAEAGGNDLLRVRHEAVSTVTVFPSRPQGRRTDSVPTEVIRGPGGTFLVSELTGGPFFPGEAKIWRVWPDGSKQPYLEGFTTIIDIDWSCDGRHLYVLQIASGFLMGGPPQLLKVDPRTNTRTLIAGPELTRPTSVLADCGRHDDDDDDGGDFAFADDDDDDDDGGRDRREVLYVSNKGDQPAIGEVLRLVR
jgi:hypothetical protein